MTLSNQISLSRIALSAVLVWCLLWQSFLGDVIAVAVFTLAALTDYWDGLVARRRGEMSSFGAFLDPLADKCLVLAALWSFVWLQLLPWWMAAVVTAREVVVTIARTAAFSQRSVAALWSGKQKTVAQIITCGVCLVALMMHGLGRTAGWRWDALVSPTVLDGLWVLSAWMMAVTVISGLHLFTQWQVAPVSASDGRAMTHPTVFASTVGGLGFVPFAPGLAGSVAGWGVAYVLRSHPWWMADAFLVGCLVACWAIPRTERALHSHDSPQIVIDETLGVLVSLWWLPWRWPVALAGLMGFRVLDVLKPCGVRRLEQLPTPWGVLVDDLACGVIVNVVLQMLVRSGVL